MSKEKAQQGYTLIKEAICELLENNNALCLTEIARSLGIESESPDGSQRSWLCYGFLQNLQCDKKIKKIDRRYYLCE